MMILISQCMFGMTGLAFVGRMENYRVCNAECSAAKTHNLPTHFAVLLKRPEDYSAKMMRYSHPHLSGNAVV